MVYEAELPSQLQAFPVQLECPCVPAQLAFYAPQPGQRIGEGVGDAQGVRLASQEGETLLQQRASLFEVPLGTQCICQRAGSKARAKDATELARDFECLLAQAHGPVVVSPMVGHDPQFSQRTARSLPISHPLVEGEALLTQRDSAVIVPLPTRHYARYQVQECPPPRGRCRFVYSVLRLPQFQDSLQPSAALTEVEILGPE